MIGLIGGLVGVFVYVSLGADRTFRMNSLLCNVVFIWRGCVLIISANRMEQDEPSNSYQHRGADKQHSSTEFNHGSLLQPVL